MAYKVLKREFPLKRPNWLVRILMRVSPVVYSICHEEEEARHYLQMIETTFRGSPELALRRRLTLVSSPDSVELRGVSGRKIISFHIDKNYCTR